MNIGISLGITRSGGAGAPLGPLDLVSGAVAAYSVGRKLRAGYTGDLVRLRRSSDDAEKNFGAGGGGRLDAAAVTAWLGGSSGFITTIFDQSGNARDMAQSTTARQPGYLASGIGSRPSASYDGSDDRMTNAALGAVYSGSDIPMTVLLVARATTFAATRTLWSLSTTATNTQCMRGEIAGTVRITRRDDAAATKGIDSGTIAAGAAAIIRAVFSGTVGNLFHNGTRVGSENTDMDLGALTLNVASLGNYERLAPTQFHLGDIPEAIFYLTALSEANASLVEDDAGTFYGVTMA